MSLPLRFEGPGLGRAVSEAVGPTKATAAELEEIRDRGYLRVAVKDNRPPLGFTDEAGELVGFEIDIARRLARDLLGDAEAVRFVPVRNVDRLNAVLESRVDVAIAAITLTEPRRRLVNFSDPYYLDGTAFVVGPTESSPAQTLPDLRSSTIAVLERSSSIPHVQYLLPGAQLVGVTSYAEGRQLLESGLADAFAGDASVLTGWVQFGGVLPDYQLLPNVISAEPLAIALPKGRRYDTLQRAVNQSLRQWYAEAWLQERSEFWGLPSGVLPSATQAPSAPQSPADE
ncbi:MAG: transporter substrate-binding domain-containing protein [Cyanobacteria bacterium J06614_10]